jgi:hypothetical protein
MEQCEVLIPLPVKIIDEALNRYQGASISGDLALSVLRVVQEK